MFFGIDVLFKMFGSLILKVHKKHLKIKENGACHGTFYNSTPVMCSNTDANKSTS